MSQPPVIIHMGDGKSRFMTTAQTMAQGLIQYLTWPGDVHKPWGNPPKVMTELGEFGVYRLDEKATNELRRAMQGMKPEKRWAAVNKNAYVRSGDKKFRDTLRNIIIQKTGAR